MHSFKRTFLDMVVWCVLGVGVGREDGEQAWAIQAKPPPLSLSQIYPASLHSCHSSIRLPLHLLCRLCAPRPWEWRKFPPACAAALGAASDVRAERGGASSRLLAPPGLPAPTCPLKEAGLRQPRHTAGTRTQWCPRASPARLPSALRRTGPAASSTRERGHAAHRASRPPGSRAAGR
jgi:hypothetical protein